MNGRRQFGRAAEELSTLSTKRKKKEQKAKRNDDYCCDEPT